jgi:hypothetical protein
MGGRKRRGSLTRSRPASDVFSRVLAVLEELFTATAKEANRRRDWWPKAVIGEGNRGSCSVVFLSSETALEEPLGMAEGG